jgi:hypothetical protein
VRIRLRWPRDNLYPLKLALISPTRGGRSVGIVRFQTKTTEFFFYCLLRKDWLCCIRGGILYNWKETTSLYMRSRNIASCRFRILVTVHLCPYFDALVASPLSYPLVVCSMITNISYLKKHLAIYRDKLLCISLSLDRSCTVLWI